ncbi:hypothetical protein [Helicobacter sp.]|uniref:hypothetical protein n=1 Tax=Helicobacter sp. TaxID=218 RepID=UPI0025874AA1|nr:hypothetical protein [Helicobacter sp.]MCI7048044.1 hypothetical protein [Helicobacter sp.]
MCYNYAMKKACEILSHLYNNPLYKKLSQHQQIQHFIVMLPFSLRQGIHFCYSKNSILYFVLKHPCFKQEFDYKLTIIKQLLKQYQKIQNKLLDIKDLKAFVGKSAYQKSLQESTHKVASYGELSSGEFENLAKNQEIYEIFEEIKKVIVCNH